MINSLRSSSVWVKAFKNAFFFLLTRSQYCYSDRYRFYFWDLHACLLSSIPGKYPGLKIMPSGAEHGNSRLKWKHTVFSITYWNWLQTMVLNFKVLHVLTGLPRGPLLIQWWRSFTTAVLFRNRGAIKSNSCKIWKEIVKFADSRK